MRKKKKAFTLLELIITLSITVVVLGTIYTFFLSNSKTIITTEINTDLQTESQKIQNQSLECGTEANSIYSLNGIEVKSNNMEYSDVFKDSDKLAINEITFQIEGDKYTFSFNSSTRILTLRKNLEGIVELSQNVKEFQIRPLDYRMKPDGKLYDANGVEISYILNVKRGYSDVTIPASVIVKFRNK